MHESDDNKFSALMTGLCEAYGYTPTARRVALYKHALADLSYEELRDACARVVRESKFFPTIADLRRHVEPVEDDAALIGWAGLQNAAEAVGSYSSIVLEDGAVGAAVIAVFGSWPQFCALSEAAVAGRQKEFIAAYRQAKRTGKGLAMRLQGTCEISGGYQVSQHVWAGLLSVSGEVSTVRDNKAQALLETAPSRSISLDDKLRLK